VSAESRIHVLYFAIARERVGLRDEWIPWVAGEPVRALMDALVERHPTLAGLRPHLRVSVNQEFASDDAPVPANAEIALIPPVSGGSGGGLFQVVDRPLQLQEVVDAVADVRYGGLVTFTGAVRGETRGRRVVRLEYEAYVPMAEAKLSHIADEANARWPGVRVAIVHRIGSLIPGDAAVVIATAAAHRAEAFRACEYLIERLKQDVPIFKKEFFEDGGVWVGMGP
jgi:molybdopterin converting factor subunit 1